MSDELTKFDNPNTSEENQIILLKWFNQTNSQIIYLHPSY